MKLAASELSGAILLACASLACSHRPLAPKDASSDAAPRDADASSANADAAPRDADASSVSADAVSSDTLVPLEDADASGGDAGAPGADADGAVPVDGSGEAADGPLSAAPTYPGFTLVLDEEFDRPLDLDHDPVWTWGDGAPTPGTTRFQRGGLAFTGGQLIITISQPASPVPSGPSYSQPTINSEKSTAPQRTTVSGELRTRYNNYRYGRYETRLTASAPPETGGERQVAFFFVNRQPQWQEWNEIDLAVWPHQAPSLVFTVANRLTMSAFVPPTSGALDAGAAFSPSQTHDYAITWLPDRIDWIVDGVVVRTGPMSGLDAVPPSHSAKIAVNLWTFSQASPPSPQLDYPVTLAVDYVRFYKWDKETTYPCSPTPGCLPAADLDFARNNEAEVPPPP
jgi:hypothetical protein